jgi:TorA maturation chaperone TorD
MTPDAVDTTSIVALAVPLRSDVYALLAALLARAPSCGRLEQLADMAVLHDIPPSLAQAVAALKTAAVRCNPGAVAREYQALFVGLGRGEVMPYASWYADRTLMGAPLARLRRDLGRLPIRRGGRSSEPEDHAAALCEMMRLLVVAPELPPERQAAFFQAHLAPWMPRFFKDLREAPSANFYRSVGFLGGVFMELESEFLPDQPPKEE